ncbi:MAG: lipid-A-disaccharide synthase [Alphaproteobacteria bacterium GWF2_58_20]|nr:MAG: lipid-A-disaccharide synthase [Alphaproteobacteria bacterium GWF2_58_20]
MHVFLLAGEPSGDLLGARLMAALKRLDAGIRFSGVGGAHMENEGLSSLFPMEELSVMGLAEVLPRLPALLRRRDEAAKAILAQNPDVVVTIDAPDFSFRVVKKARYMGCKTPMVHYVAPSVWAWRPGRAKKLATLYDHVLCLLPFEPPYFEREGMQATFIGHSSVESGAGHGDGAGFRVHHGIGMEEKILCLLPGSRGSEMKYLVPLFKDVLSRLPQEMRIVLPTLPRWQTHLETQFPQAIVFTGEAEKWNAFAASDVALAASGTVTLELALAGVPTITTNRMGHVSTWLFRLLLKNRYFALPNLVLDREAMPEMFFGKCNAVDVSQAVRRLLESAEARDMQKQALSEAVVRITPQGGKSPSDMAARAVWQYRPSPPNGN